MMTKNVYTIYCCMPSEFNSEVRFLIIFISFQQIAVSWKISSADRTEICIAGLTSKTEATHYPLISSPQALNMGFASPFLKGRGEILIWDPQALSTMAGKNLSCLYTFKLKKNWKKRRCGGWERSAKTKKYIYIHICPFISLISPNLICSFISLTSLYFGQSSLWFH